MAALEAIEVIQGVFIIDTCFNGIPGFDAVYIIKGGERLALVDAGHHTTSNAVLEGIRSLGIRPDNIDYIFCTHIHMDHFGGVGQLLPRMPRAKVVVQEQAAELVTNVGRLLGSLESQGANMTARELIKSVPAGRIVAVKGGERFSLGSGQEIQVFATPGHCPHSVTYLYSPMKAAFVGDALGIWLEEDTCLVPLVTPYGYDQEQAIASLKALSVLPLEALLLTHYGMTRQVKEVLHLAREKIIAYSEVVRVALESGNALQVEEKLRERLRYDLKTVSTHSPLIYKFIVERAVTLFARGYVGYLSK